MSQLYWDLYYLNTGLLPQMALAVSMTALLVGVFVKFIRAL